MSIKDRGHKKWGGFMLPEHLRMLAALQQDSRRQKPPEPDPIREEAIQEALQYAWESKKPIVLRCWGEFDDFLVRGYLVRGDSHAIVLQDSDGQRHSVPPSIILEAEVDED